MSHPLLLFIIGGVNLDHIGNWQWWTGVLIAVIIAGFTGFGVGYAFCNQTSKWLLDSTAWEKKHPSESSADAAIVPAPVVSSSKPRKTVLGRLNTKTKDHKS